MSFFCPKYVKSVWLEGVGGQTEKKKKSGTCFQSRSVHSENDHVAAFNTATTMLRMEGSWNVSRRTDKKENKREKKKHPGCLKLNLSVSVLFGVWGFWVLTSRAFFSFFLFFIVLPQF